MEIIDKGWLSPYFHNSEKEGAVDLFGAIQEPSFETLLKLYDDTLFICAQWLSDEVSKTKLGVYVKTSAKPKCVTRKPIYKALPAHLQNESLREVEEHAAKRLLQNPNDHMSLSDLLKTIDGQLSITGNAFLHKVRESSWEETIQGVTYRKGEGYPDKLIPLQVQDVELAYDNHKVLVGIWYGARTQRVFIALTDLIWFKLFNDPGAPFGLGRGPARGVYERILLTKYELSYITSLYRNQARPDSIISAPGTTPEQRERLQKEFHARFDKGGIGGVWVTDPEEITIQTLNWSPKDVLGTELYKWTKLQVINAFKLNPAVLDQESSNRATAYVAKLQAQEYAVVPRLRHIEEKLTKELMPDFDSRLLVAFDNPIKEDSEQAVQERSMYVQSGIKTINEVRSEMGLPPVSWGNVPSAPNPEGKIP